jgi:hypothetical protein
MRSRQEPTDSAQKRPPTATQNAPRLLPEDADPELAAVVHGWPKLPEALKAAVMAILRSTSGGGGR